jgi:hypothetical protein
MAPAIRVQWGFVLWVFRDLSVMAQALLAGEEVHLGVELKVLFRPLLKERHNLQYTVSFSDTPTIPTPPQRQR